jgi:hypothetical protein
VRKVAIIGVSDQRCRRVVVKMYDESSINQLVRGMLFSTGNLSVPVLVVASVDYLY